LSASAKPLLSLIIPCLNEEAVLPLLHRRLQDVLASLGMDWELIFVDDGSRDRTLALLSDFHAADPRVKVVGLSRNFGHQAALAAGLRYAAGDAVAILDADLQDPPELLPACLDQWRAGYEVVFAVRQKRKDSLFKRATASLFYRLLRKLAEVEIPLDSGDFCVLDRRVVEVLRAMPERNLFVRGMRAWAGFRQTAITYERDARAAGSTKYPLKKMFRFALDGIFAFSTVPLRLATWFGLSIVALSAAVVVFVVIWRVCGFYFMGHTGHDVPGWAATMVSLFFLGGVQLLILGIIGEYLARIYNEVKQRPRWVVSQALGFEQQRQPGQVE
jgi:glycosyltransferase involved in cell wall biosynthesis